MNLKAEFTRGNGLFWWVVWILYIFEMTRCRRVWFLFLVVSVRSLAACKSPSYVIRLLKYQSRHLTLCTAFHQWAGRNSRSLFLDLFLSHSLPWSYMFSLWSAAAAAVCRRYNIFHRASFRRVFASLSCVWAGLIKDAIAISENPTSDKRRPWALRVAPFSTPPAHNPSFFIDVSSVCPSVCVR